MLQGRLSLALVFISLPRRGSIPKLESSLEMTPLPSTTRLPRPSPPVLRRRRRPPPPPLFGCETEGLLSLPRHSHRFRVIT